jgi:hypothetical protein
MGYQMIMRGMKWKLAGTRSWRRGGSVPSCGVERESTNYAARLSSFSLSLESEQTICAVHKHAFPKIKLEQSEVVSLKSLKWGYKVGDRVFRPFTTVDPLSQDRLLVWLRT